MTDLRLTAHEWATAQAVCTEKQITALDIWRRGGSYGRIAQTLDITRATARAHVVAGQRRIARHLEAAAA